MRRSRHWNPKSRRDGFIWRHLATRSVGPGEETDLHESGSSDPCSTLRASSHIRNWWQRRTNWHRDPPNYVCCSGSGRLAGCEYRKPTGWLTNADHLEVLTKQCPGGPLHLHPPLAGLSQGQKLWRGSAFRQWDMQWDTSTGQATWFWNIRELRRKSWRTWRPL